MCTESCKKFVALNLRKKEIKNKRVLEVGSYNVNGSCKESVMKLEPSEYIGVDIRMGPNVDVLCDIANLVRKFGENSFDVVICTEVLEHVYNWKGAINQLKMVCKNVIFITTRSKGFPVHDYPDDFWRYETSDMIDIFNDFIIRKCQPDLGDKNEPGVFLKACRDHDHFLTDLSGFALFSVKDDKRVCYENYKSLDELALEYGTDKSSKIHNYTKWYEMHLGYLRRDINNLLEIGIWEGASLRMWRDYFEYAMIHGIDSDNSRSFTERGIKTYLCDQSNVEDINKLKSMTPYFDIIIDDGSHIGDDVIKTFNLMFNRVKMGGWYVIEDTQASYDSRLKTDVTTMEFFKGLLDQVNLFNGSTYYKEPLANIKWEQQEFSYHERWIECMYFYPRMIFIKKREG